MTTKRTIQIQHYEAPCGELLLGSIGDRLCLCNWTVEKHPGRVDKRAYFRRERTTFDLPLLFAGTDFQKRVWDLLLTIPYGETLSYGELARRLGLPNATRAVANANGANAISIFAPCHRVIGSDGTLTGYGGGLAAKRFLLELEKNSIQTP